MITPAFDDKWIDNMLTGACDIDEDIKHIYIGVDPAGGKTKNLYAVCSMVVTNDGNCIVWNIRLFFLCVCVCVCIRTSRLACVSDTTLRYRSRT